MIESAGSTLRYVTSGCVKSGEGDLAARLKAILEGLNEVIALLRRPETLMAPAFVLRVLRAARRGPATPDPTGAGSALEPSAPARGWG